MEPCVELSCTELRIAAEERFDCLVRAYRCVLVGSCPDPRAADLARVIFSGMCRPFPAECCHEDAVALTCVSVTLVEKMSSILMCSGAAPQLRLYAELCVTALLHDMDLMSLLLQQFQAEEQIVRHVSAKTVSVCVLYELHASGMLSPVWQLKCVQAFHSLAPSADLDVCMWSLCDILKRLLKEQHPELTVKLVAAFDSSVAFLCSVLLPDVRVDDSQSAVDLSSTCWGNTLCLLLDLLEVLTVSGFICGSGMCLTSQRLIYIHTSVLLTTVCCSRTQYFARKRVLLLLKRAVMGKLGEDWAPEEEPTFEQCSSHLNALARSVLQVATADWFGCIQVQSASFFGGISQVRGDAGQEADSVMLRALSLLLLKSMELQIQTSAGAGVHGATDDSGYLQTLWGFLRQCSVQLMEVTHRCCWLSLLFGEQDDDMMEAAKALLSIFLHRRFCFQSPGSLVLEAACATGCNPHCIFLLLLQSVSFDHSVLLDFLISTETCFLKYFVWYLKYLRTDLQGFTLACLRMSDCHCPPQQPLLASCGSDLPESSSCFQPTAAVLPVEGASPTPGLRLVEYASSGESDPESMDVSEDLLKARRAMCQSAFMNSDVEQDTSGQNDCGSSDCTGPSEPEKGAEGSAVAAAQTEHTHSLLSTQPTHRAVLCLSKLRALLCRLHMKKLFPYNPSSLLKLLEQVETTLTSASSK